MPFTRINFRDTSVEVEHEIDATEEEIIQLAREKLAAAKKQQAELAAAEEAARLANQEAVPLKSQQEQLAAEQLAVEQRGSLGRTGVGLAAEVAVAEGGKLAGTRAGALIGGRLGAVGGLAGVAAGTILGGGIGYAISAIGAGAAGSYIRQKISRPGGEISEGQMVADVFINLLPYTKLGKGADLATKAARQFAAGGAIATGATITESLIDHGNLPTLEELAKVGLTGGVLSVGLHMTGEAFNKSYQKYGGRSQEDLLDGLRKRDPDAQALFDGVMKAAVKNNQETNVKIDAWWTKVRENFDDDKYRLLRLQDVTANGWVKGGKLPEEYGDLSHLRVAPDMPDPKTGKIIKGNDAYMYMTLSKGVVQNETKKLNAALKIYSDGLKLKSKQYGTSVDQMSQQIETYLHAKRAVYFNKKMWERGYEGDFPSGKTPAGQEMTDIFAEEVIGDFEKDLIRPAGGDYGYGGSYEVPDSSMKTMYKPELKILTDLAENVRKTLYEGGIITEKRLKELKKDDPNWVSFRRIPEEGVDVNHADDFFFRGSDVTDPTSLKAAKGGEGKVSIFKNLVDANLEAIRLAENNKANLVFKRLLEEPINRKTAKNLVQIKRAHGAAYPKPDDPVITVFDNTASYGVRGSVEEAITDGPRLTHLKKELDDLPDIEDIDQFINRRQKEFGDMLKTEATFYEKTGILPVSGQKTKKAPPYIWQKAMSKVHKDRANPKSEYSTKKRKEAEDFDKITNVRKKLEEEIRALEERQGIDEPNAFAGMRPFATRSPQGPDDPMWRKHESTKFYIDFSEGVEKEIALGLRGVNRSQLNTLLKGSYFINKALGAVYTGGSPLSFTPANFVRDRMVSAMNTFRYLDGSSFKNIINPRVAASHMNSIRRGLFNKKPDEPGYEAQQARLTTEQKELDIHRVNWENSGGPSGGIVTNLFREIEKDMQGFSMNSNDFSLKGLTGRAKAFISFIRKGNEIIEDGTRFSVYMQHIQKGASPSEAAFYSNNASFNPRQQGLKGDTLKALYLFSNPTIQSTKNFWRGMKDPKLWKPVLGFTFGTAVALEAYNSLMDPDWRDKVKGGPDKSSWRLNKNLVAVSPFPNSDGSLSYTQIPLAHEVSPIWTSLSGMAQLMTGSSASANKIIKETSKAIIDGYNPTGGSIIPTVPLRIAELTMLNKDGLGREIVPQRLLEENMAAYGKVHPWTAQTVGGEIAIELSKEIENLGVQVSPEKLGYLFQLSFGGMGQDTLRLFDLTSKMFNREEINIRDIPLFRRFFGSTYADAFEKRTGMEPDLKLFEYEQNTLSSQNYQDAFFILDKINNIEDPAEKDMTLRAELALANKSVSRRVRKILNDQAKGITRTDRDIRKLGVENGLRSEFYQAQIEKMAPESVGQFLLEQKRKNILTDNVEKQLRIANALRTINADESKGRRLPLIDSLQPY